MTVYEVVLEGRQGINDMLNVFHYDDLGTAPADWADVAAIFEGHLEDHVITWCGPRVTWLGITYRIDSPGAVGTFIPLPGGVLAGTNAADDQADVLAMMIRKRSGGIIRPTRGWFMQGGITSSSATGVNTWGTTQRAAVLAYAEDIRVLNLPGPSTLQMVIKASNPSAPNTQPYSAVATFDAVADPRTQRTRLAQAGS